LRKKVTKFSLYNIPLKNLSAGTHNYEYQLDRKYFEAIDGDEVKKGNVKVELSVKRVSSTFDFKFHVHGIVQIPCDRCLDEMDQEIESDNHFIVKFGKEYSEESDEIIIIPEEEGEINIAWFLYEFIALGIPMKHVHEPGKCNRIMSKKLQKHRAVDSNDPDDVEDTEDFDDGKSTDIEDTAETGDPRWDVLKDINFDENYN
jgi:Predicted metal-binding, possibly nucleic acid-binding protein